MANLSHKTIPFSVSGVGDGLHVIDCSYENTVNSGIRWSATLDGIVSSDVLDKVQKCTLKAGDWTSSPLVVLDSDIKTKGGKGTTTLSGTDEASYILTAEGLSLPTLHDLVGQELIYTLASRAMGIIVSTRTVIQVTNNPDGSITITQTIFNGDGSSTTTSTINSSSGFAATISFNGSLCTGMLQQSRIESFDMQGGGVGEYITRLMRDFACNYRINATGKFEIFDVDQDMRGMSSIVTGSASQKWNLSNKYTQVWCRKSSRTQGIYSFHIQKPGMGGGDLGDGFAPSSLQISIGAGALGSLAYVAFFTGPGGTGQLCGYFALDPNFGITGSRPGGVFNLSMMSTSAGHARSVVWSAEPAVNNQDDLYLIVRGRLSSQFNYDAAFTSTYPTDHFEPDPNTGLLVVIRDGDYAPRQRHLIVESPLWPTQAIVDQLAPKILLEANKGCHTITREVEFNPSILPGGYMDADVDGPRARYDSVSWRGGSGGVGMTITGWVPTII